MKKLTIEKYKKKIEETQKLKEVTIYLEKEVIPSLNENLQKITLAIISLLISVIIIIYFCYQQISDNPYFKKHLVPLNKLDNIDNSDKLLNYIYIFSSTEEIMLVIIFTIVFFQFIDFFKVDNPFKKNSKLEEFFIGNIWYEWQYLKIYLYRSYICYSLSMIFICVYANLYYYASCVDGAFNYFDKDTKIKQYILDFFSQANFIIIIAIVAWFLGVYVIYFLCSLKNIIYYFCSLCLHKKRKKIIKYYIKFTLLIVFLIIVIFFVKSNL